MANSLRGAGCQMKCLETGRFQTLKRVEEVEAGEGKKFEMGKRHGWSILSHLGIFGVGLLARARGVDDEANRFELWAVAEEIAELTVEGRVCRKAEVEVAKLGLARVV